MLPILNRVEFSELTGVCERKLEKYVEHLLEVIRQAEAEAL